MRISYSAFDTFNRCPLKYKFSYVERIKVPKKPEFYFGGLIHEIVQYALKKDPIIPSIDELLQYLQDHWQEDAFASKQEAKQYFDFGQNMLRNFYSSLKPGLRNIIATEKRFFLPLNDKHVLNGVIDRIDKLPFGAYEVIDYKTSKNAPTQQDVDRDKQLGIYKLAVKSMWPEAEDIRLTLYFLKHPQKITTSRRDDEVETLKEEIIATAEKIEKETDFPPKANNFCNWCEYGNLCPLQKQKFDKENQKSKTMPKGKNQNEIENIIKEYVNATQTIKKLEPQIHKHFDSEKIERFFHKEGVITRGKNKKLTIRKS